MTAFNLAGIEVRGQDILSFMDAMGNFVSSGSRLLQELKIGTLMPSGNYQIVPVQWYPMEDKLRILDELGSRVGPATLRRVGEMVPRNAQMPAWITDIHSAFAALDAAYHMNHRKDGRLMFDEQTGQITDGIGHYGYRKVPGENLIISVCDTPHPSHCDEGLLFAIARRFEPRATVRLAPDQPTRRDGGASCTFLVSWSRRG